ncbi:MAG: hypothetical protein Q9227_005459 [Pyrenula ochraceoflavens]
MALFAAFAVALTGLPALTNAYTWKNVVTGGGGGFTPGIAFNAGAKGVTYLRTDIGGLYKLNTADDSWTPLLDFADDSTWHDWGVDAVAPDPIDTQIVYAAVGMYTNSWLEDLLAVACQD